MDNLGGGGDRDRDGMLCILFVLFLFMCVPFMSLSNYKMCTAWIYSRFVFVRLIWARLRFVLGPFQIFYAKHSLGVGCELLVITASSCFHPLKQFR